jgi:class 3 adenylate cyclase
VNLAARMETFSEPMQITLSEDMQRLLREDFRCTERGRFEVKGFGERRLYSLDSAHDLRPRDDL